MSLKNKLNRMKTHMNLEPVKLPSEEENNHIVNEEIPYLEKWQENDTVSFHFDDDYCFIREVRYPINHKHGLYAFSELKKIVNEWNQTSLEHPLSARGVKSEDLFFFDTETTGLGGGAGNTIFLLGYAYLEGEEVVVKQHILPQPGSEIPLYQSFLENINYETLVTYNGKSFDWPQLKTRHTLVKEHVPKLPEFGHFDLYHASRRLWKNKLERVKLSVVETDILGVHREDDIPGYLAPMIYFDFVERKNPEILFGIMKHNELDILSLITLYIHLSRKILQIDGYTEESMEIARWLAYLGKKEESVETYEKIVEAGNEEDRIIAGHALAFQKKKQQQFNEALEIWKEVALKGNVQIRIQAQIECAKLYEHQFKEVGTALKCAKIAQQEMVREGTIPGKKQLELEKRIRRLEKKEESKGISV
ncbi:ribonuclease H-like domain-containing protein [Peribacillus sp. NJ11]|uniref:ribonuclease H-like domain-containing protein n=1 Tax=Peribacillus sp. NJ11 TaxID=3055861 RepID=UPI0025A2A542|nr:ribonuclease H-like domain-containing protein [Peribacillus sp. NJ11]MDM5222233.1 ribonuclease H-like domain-containing protein [Peribacillus sp. NJ11]